MKVCFKCKNNKPLSDFYRHSQMSDGYLGKCKECTKIDNFQNRRKREEYYIDFDRKRANLPHRLEYRNNYIAEYRKKNPLVYKAHIITNNAVRDGKLTKKPCRFCGGNKVEAHHSDYNKPLFVDWLCAKHHRRLHAGSV